MKIACRLSFLLLIAACTGSRTKITLPPATSGKSVQYWLTRSDQSVLLQQQSPQLFSDAPVSNQPVIEVDTATQYQTIDGFGYTLTGGSARLINDLPDGTRAKLLQELFGETADAIGISYLRISIGASDLNADVFSYDDLPAGQTDSSLAYFSLAKDGAAGTGLIPLLNSIIAIHPGIKIIAAPWSAPVWMKDNGSTKGGGLQPAWYNVYAQYFVRYIQQMKAAGITIDAVTPQNEPLNPGNNPSLVMTAEQQREFIKNNLGPAFAAAGISAKIIAYDHNCDRPDFPLTVLADAGASRFTDGAAFHLYNGDIAAMGQVHTAYPAKNVYFTEQYTASNGNFGGDLQWHLKNVIIGSMRNWSRVALEWNLANDEAFNPHTPGGCTTCKGALTIGNTITRNTAYYIIAHASKFVPAGSVRVASNISANLQNVAFVTPAGKKVLIVLNDNSTAISFNIRYNNKWASLTMDAGAVGTLVW